MDRAAENDPEAFTGNSDLAIVDFVWKWAPEGNSIRQNFKLQGEYCSRSEKGVFAGLPFNGDQDGWYLQGFGRLRQPGAPACVTTRSSPRG